MQHGTLKSYPGLPPDMLTTHDIQIRRSFTFVIEGGRVPVGPCGPRPQNCALRLQTGALPRRAEPLDRSRTEC